MFCVQLMSFIYTFFNNLSVVLVAEKKEEPASESLDEDIGFGLFD